MEGRGHGAQRCSVRTIKFGTALTSLLLTLRAPWPLPCICLVFRFSREHTISLPSAATVPRIAALLTRLRRSDHAQERAGGEKVPKSFVLRRYSNPNYLNTKPHTHTLNAKAGCEKLPKSFVLRRYSNLN